MHATPQMIVSTDRRIDAVLDRLRDPLLLAGRVLIAALFVYDATVLVRSPEAIAAYMEEFGVPSLLLYPTAILQFAGGLMIVIGFRARPAALALAAFCLATALLFHRQLADPNELIQFGKDLGLAGGYLFLAAAGAGRFSLDRRLHRNA